MPSKTWKEDVAADEGARFEGYGRMLRDLQRRAGKGRSDYRALHAKAHAGFEATFEVLADVPAHAKVGLFAEPKTYRAYVRYSNGSGMRAPDARGDLRGFAVKVVGVSGRKIIPGMEDAPTQDFLCINARATPFRTPDEFMSFVRAASSPALLLPRMIGAFGFFGAFSVLKRALAMVNVPVASAATLTYYTPVPIRLGEHAVRYAFVPVGAASPTGDRRKSPDALREELQERLRNGPLVYEMRLQFYEAPDKTPIEDSSADWKDEDSPWVAVARLELPQQDATSERGKRLDAFIESLSFDPWHALEEMRPLGATMRARNVAYRYSTQERGAAKEPDGAERFD